MIIQVDESTEREDKKMYLCITSIEDTSEILILMEEVLNWECFHCLCPAQGVQWASLVCLCAQNVHLIPDEKTIKSSANLLNVHIICLSAEMCTTILYIFHVQCSAPKLSRVSSHFVILISLEHRRVPQKSMLSLLYLVLTLWGFASARPAAQCTMHKQQLFRQDTNRRSAKQKCIPRWPVPTIHMCLMLNKNWDTK